MTCLMSVPTSILLGQNSTAVIEETTPDGVVDCSFSANTPRDNTNGVGQTETPASHRDSGHSWPPQTVIVKDPNTTKSGLSAYDSFANERRENVLEEKPGLGEVDVDLLLSERCKTLNETQRAPYNAKAIADSRPDIRPSTKMSNNPPFEVSKVWQEAMAMVSVNAGLWPREVITQYYRQQPIQKHEHPNHTDVDMTNSKRAAERNIQAVTIRYEDQDPGKISVMIIFVDELDPNTNKPIVRLVTNTSINHVLAKNNGANCQLWLKVHSDVKHSPTPYQIIPCCKEWVEDLDCGLPMSNEEKLLPEAVDRLFREMRRLEALLREKEKELQERNDELDKLRGVNKLAVFATDDDMFRELQQWTQHWPYIAIALLFIVVILLLK